jgi:hypothetical protein
MKSATLPQFWKLYQKLPKDIQHRANIAYQMWQRHPRLSGLQFKRVSKTRPVYSVRIGDTYRALGLLHEDTVTWFWIGHHDEYERLLKQLQ